MIGYPSDACRKGSQGPNDNVLLVVNELISANDLQIGGKSPPGTCSQEPKGTSGQKTVQTTGKQFMAFSLSLAVTVQHILLTKCRHERVWIEIYCSLFRIICWSILSFKMDQAQTHIWRRIWDIIIPHTCFVLPAIATSSEVQNTRTITPIIIRSLYLLIMVFKLVVVMVGRLAHKQGSIMLSVINQPLQTSLFHL